ncbi:MAG: sporulation protein YqfC [Clostridia bacterium]|nr:sporulation protein YqfC [Clostridia bacterium]
MKKKKRKIPAAERAIEAIDLPSELVLGTPCITVRGDRGATVENLSGIVEYDENLLVISTSLGIFRIKGEKLTIKSLTDVDIELCGRIKGFDIDAD